MKWLSICSFSFFLVLSVQSFMSYYWKSTYIKICDIVFDNYYQPIDSLPEWHRACWKDAEGLGSSSRLDDFSRRLRFRFSRLPVSHLSFYDPSEFKNLWRGENKSTGVESHWVDGHLVVLRVWPGSPGERAGVKKGDIIIDIEGYGLDESVLAKKGGRIKITRDGNTMEVMLSAETFVRNEKVELHWLDQKTLHLRIPSFRKDFFDKKSVMEWAAEIKRAEHVIVDLRGNSGGNIVAGARFLSMLYCQPREVGRLELPRKDDLSAKSFSDSLSDIEQVKALLQYRSISIQTFANYGCFNGRVTVLIDHQTASVAEMVAASLGESDCSQLMGTVSSGRVVVAIWFPLPDLGEDYSVSVPVAAFSSPKYGVLEGIGLSADRRAFYNIDDESRGFDSWILQAMKNPPQCISSKSRSGVEGLNN